jgi:hypothetical protein
MRRLPEGAVRRQTGNGGITGETAAEVEDWKVKIERTDGDGG